MKKYRIFLYFLFISFSFGVYAQKKMKIKPKQIQLMDFPSGSGVAYQNGKIYAIGDDSPFLYIIDEKTNQINEKISLVETQPADFQGNRIKKKQKPDFEALEFIFENELVVFGSGSKSPQRDIFKRIIFGKRTLVEHYSLSEFYNHLKINELLKYSELNIEAVAYSKGFLYLFNRSNNVVIKLDYQEFLAYLKGEKFPKMELKKVVLPQIEGVEAGFSGATFLDEHRCIFTASVELHNDSYSDGKIVGSIVGVLQMADFEHISLTQHQLIATKSTPLKIESVAVLPSESTKKVNLVLISDDDKGGTTLVRKTMKVKL